MGIDKLKRVVWRLREKGFKVMAPRGEMYFAIMTEIGTDVRTVRNTIKSMKMLKMIRSQGPHKFEIISD